MSQPQWSPDHQWWWDGQQWRPASPPSPQVVPQQRAPFGAHPPPRRKRGRWIVLIAVLVLVLLVGVFAVGSLAMQNSTGTQSNTAARPATTSAQQAAAPTQPASTIPTKPTTQTAPAEPLVLLDESGDGIHNTATFIAPQNWDLKWEARNNTGLSVCGMQAFLKSPGSEAPVDVPINQVVQNKTAADLTHLHRSGTFYLNMNSTCSWHVQIVKA